MKHILKYALLYFATMCFLNCSSGDGLPGISDPSFISVANASSYIEHNGEKVAYILGLYSNFADIYIPSVDKYATVNIKSGRYRNDSVYYTQENCQGQRFTFGFTGESGKSIYFSDSKYFLVTDTTLGSEVNYVSLNFGRSADPSERCRTNPDSNPQTVYNEDGFYSLQETSRPFNFEAIAPLKIKYQ